MKFEPIITISDIINILISICTIITIVFTYLTLKEMKKQRNLSIMPNITLDFSDNLKFTFINTYKKYLKFNIVIKNIGNGVAKNLDIKININNIEKYETDNIKINDNCIYLRFKNYALITMIENSNHFTYQGIHINNSIDIESATIETLLLGQSIEIFEKYNKDTPSNTLIELIQKNTLLVDVIVKYADLENNIYKRVFKLKISPIHIDFANKELQYCIKIINYE